MTTEHQSASPPAPQSLNIVDSIYIHIPFCKQKCSYCDFVSYAGKEDLIDTYVDALVCELESQRSTLYAPLSTIYFGGGTPTLLEPKHFEIILNTLDSRKLKVDSRAEEITIEANPGTVDKEYLAELRKLGINRISFGVQSFNDKHLQLLGRIHDSKQIYLAVEDARSAGFDNISLDLIFAIPNQTLEEWKEDLKAAVSLCPEHVSTYNLQIEENTKLFDLVTHYSLPVTSQDLDADMFEFTIDYLSANGYKHYEISNFAKPGFECKHNINYWMMKNWLGIGAGAHSHVNGMRWANTNSIEEYINSRPASRITHHDSSRTTHQREAIFMGLRLLDGLDKNKFKGFESEVADLKKDGLLEELDNKLRLTKKGLFLGNLVFEKFV